MHPSHISRLPQCTLKSVWKCDLLVPDVLVVLWKCLCAPRHIFKKTSPCCPHSMADAEERCECLSMKCTCRTAIPGCSVWSKISIAKCNRDLQNGSHTVPTFPSSHGHTEAFHITFLPQVKRPLGAFLVQGDYEHHSPGPNWAYAHLRCT